nr:MAG: hypothetical protein [Bacteriophage sp.]UWF99467.1 MAG: hypothetical protein [Bacteriophage sp.]UWG30342.1 MAG: hypothetical protein [Bacteriophage sp.]UWH99730.1 MAG: hypothetical protein [Bacteriophage sp.]DAG06979.1 MAG TPA: protein of unknown function DUF5053 [Caudoviricetes sp.]
MKRLTLNQDSEIKVKDIYGKMHDCKDVPNEFYGCIRKLYDYENTGFNPEEIEIIVEALEDMRNKLYKAGSPNAYSVSNCCKTLNAILEVREKRKKEKSAEALQSLNG